MANVSSMTWLSWSVISDRGKKVIGDGLAFLAPFFELALRRLPLLACGRFSANHQVISMRYVSCWPSMVPGFPLHSQVYGFFSVYAEHRPASLRLDGISWVLVIHFVMFIVKCDKISYYCEIQW